MLGLAVTGGEGPEPDVLRLLVRGADVVAAADSGLTAAENAGISPDWIIGDMDSVDSLLLKKYPADRVISFPHDKDFTDTELALDLLWKKGCSRIWIAGGGGGRLDHLLALSWLFERGKFPERWITFSDDVYCLDSLSLNEIKMKFAPGTTVSVLPLGTGEWKAQSKGLKWPLDNVVWDRGSIAISNRTTTDSFSIFVTKGRFMVILPITRQEQ